ncbi:MAG: CpaF family protein, partial [Acidimicrobiia bacterium]
CHANGPADALRRLETMVLTGGVGLPLAAVRDQIAASLDLVVQVARGAGGCRRVVAVAEVVDDPAAASDPAAVRVVPLADPTALRRLPARPPRAPAAGEPRPEWCRQ